jgi:hypothetical protein
MTVLDSALSEHNPQIAGLAADTIDRELRDLSEFFPEPRNASVTGGAASRSSARAQVKNLVLVSRQISVASEYAKFDEAAAQLAALRREFASTVETLEAAQKWSLFDRDNHDAHFAAVRALNRASIDPRSARVRRPDND